MKRHFDSRDKVSLENDALNQHWPPSTSTRSASGSAAGVTPYFKCDKEEAATAERERGSGDAAWGRWSLNRADSGTGGGGTPFDDGGLSNGGTGGTGERPSRFDATVVTARVVQRRAALGTTSGFHSFVDATNAPAAEQRPGDRRRDHPEYDDAVDRAGAPIVHQAGHDLSRRRRRQTTGDKRWTMELRSQTIGA